MDRLTLILFVRTRFLNFIQFRHITHRPLLHSRSFVTFTFPSPPHTHSTPSYGRGPSRDQLVIFSLRPNWNSSLLRGIT